MLDFEHLYEDMEKMLPSKMQQTLHNLKIKNVRLNANVKSPVADNSLRKSLQSLKPQIYKRLCQLYEKDFTVFGYSYPDFDKINNADFLP